MWKCITSVLLLSYACCISCSQADQQVDANILMYTNLWDAVLNKGKIEMIDVYFTQNAVSKTVSMELNGRKAIKAYYASMLKSFSKIHFTVDDVFGSGDRLVKRWTFSGVHSGDFSGIPATGRSIKFSGVTMVRLADGKISEEIDYSDDLGLMQQLGGIVATKP